MANKKHLHKLIINEEPKRGKTFTYTFSHTKDIEIVVNKSGLSISVYLTKLYDKDEMLCGNSYLFPDAIRKAMLIYLLLNNQCIEIKKITVSIDDELSTIDYSGENNTVPIYSLIDGKLKRDLPTISDEAIKGILSQTKSQTDSRMAALFAYITSKSKTYEDEKFIYLWMAFNGMYGYLGQEFNKNHPDENGNIPKTLIKECNLIQYMQLFIGQKNAFVPKEVQTKIAREIKSYIKYIDNEKISEHSLKEGIHKELCKEIEDFIANTEKTFNETIDKENFEIQKKNNEINKRNNEIKKQKNYNKKDLGKTRSLKKHAYFFLSAYCYLLTQFSYYYRCNIIHASQPLDLFSYKDDIDIKCLRVINNILDDFIGNNLFRWFESEYESDLISKIKNIEKIS